MCDFGSTAVRYTVACLMFVLGLLLVTGCEEKSSRVEEPCDFSVEIDGPPCVLKIELDKNLVEDQGKIAQQFPATFEQPIVPETPKTTGGNRDSEAGSTKTPTAYPAEAGRVER